MGAGQQIAGANSHSSLREDKLRPKSPNPPHRIRPSLSLGSSDMNMCALHKLRDKGLIRLYVWRTRISFVAKRGKGCLSEAEFQDLVRGVLQKQFTPREENHSPTILSKRSL
jgi:hypothetical protein